jgi:hypothetical protein
VIQIFDPLARHVRDGRRVTEGETLVRLEQFHDFGEILLCTVNQLEACGIDEASPQTAISWRCRS